MCLYVGYGIAAGLILNGESYRGGYGNAGEIGKALFSSADKGRTSLEHRASLASLYKHMGMDAADAHAYERLEELASAGDRRIMNWIDAAAPDLCWCVHLIETIFDPQTVILSSGAPRSLARRLFEAVQPLVPSIADRPGRALPRLQLGIADPWAIALGAAAEPISRAFDPNFSAMLKAGSNGN